jgi:ABC-type nitrate/sulfonate/bicarbonate transport system permease component
LPTSSQLDIHLRASSATTYNAAAPASIAVAEFVAGTGGAETGLAFRILEAGYRLAIPRLFAALFLLSMTGIVIYLVLDFLSRLLLRHWHESAIEEEEE